LSATGFSRTLGAHQGSILGTERAIALSQNQHSRPWFALTVKPRHESAAARNLRWAGLEEYLPLYPSRRHWSDRVKTVVLPLFPGYVFCRFDPRERWTVLSTPGVTSVVGFAKTDQPVGDLELAAVRTLVASGLPLEPWPSLQAGDPVRIEHGPLAGLRGMLLREKGAWRVVVNVDLLRRGVAVEIDRHLISAAGDWTAERP
jgi:transcription antitermination factor NusG